MEMAALRARMLELGFRFNPTPQEAVTHTLPRLIAGELLHPAIRPYLHDTDIYACEPGVLAAQFQPTPRTGDRFFFTTCKRQPSQKAGKASRAVRAAGPGSWHSQGNTTDVKDGAGVKIGEVKKLRYKKGGKFTDWLMDEFSSCSQDAVVGDTQRVLCKIYVSPRAAPDSVARQEDAAAAAAFAPPQPEETFVAHKRPSPPVVDQPCPKRPRHAVAPSSAPSATRSPASTLAPALAPTGPVQTSTTVQEACSPVAARDPFCTESPATAEDDVDFEFVSFLNGNLETEEAEEDEARDDTDWFAAFTPANHTMASPNSVARQEDAAAAAVFATPAPLEEPAACQEFVAAPKRPAPHVAEPPCPKRPRHAVVPTPQMVTPSVQVSTDTVAQDVSSPVAARDPFFTESPAAAQDDDDFDLVSLVEGALLETEQAEEGEAQDDTDWFAAAMARDAKLT
ncbi:hypothetical protein EJB05_29660, partial [Eragrostis curvula]